MEEIKVLITEEEIANRVAELAHQIMNDYPNKEIVLIGVLTGAVYFAVDLSRRIDNKLKLEFVKVKSYDHDVSNQAPEWKLQLQDSIEGKDVIVVEDIIDSGITLNFLLDSLKVQKAKSIKLCVLLNKKIEKKHNIKCDYIGFDIEDKYVIGYGLDSEEYYRNLPYIGYKEVKEDKTLIKK